MKRLITLILILYGINLSGLAIEVDKQYRKSFSGITSINCDLPFLNIKLVGDETTKDVNINATIVGSYKTSRGRHQEIDIKFNTNSGLLSITLEGPKQWINTRFEKAEIIINCPQDIEYSLNNINRDISIINTVGEKSRANSISGNIYCKDINGKGSLDVETSSGRVKVNNSNKILYLNSISGDIYCNDINNDISATSISGRINIQNSKGSIDSESSSGNISISEAEGDIQCNSISGRIKLNNIDCKFANTNSISGDIYLSNHNGNCDIESSSGRIKLTNFHGQVNIETISGSIIGNELFLNGENSFSTHSGNTNVKLKNNIENVSLDAKSDFGSVQVGSFKGKRIKRGEGNTIIIGHSVSGVQNYQFINNF
ncbi:MAG: DUF4097 domain-containing protein [Hyphomicrobiales bacterium]